MHAPHERHQDLLQQEPFSRHLIHSRAVLWQQDIRKWVHNHNDRGDLEYMLFHAENRAHKLLIELNNKVAPGGLFNPIHLEHGMEVGWDEELNPEVWTSDEDPSSGDEDLPPIPLRPRRTTVQDI
jgi:hypothetical protein